jgi:hypothetical protein
LRGSKAKASRALKIEMVMHGNGGQAPNRTTCRKVARAALRFDFLAFYSLKNAPALSARIDAPKGNVIV